MALASTTLSGAVVVDQTSVQLASATGVVAGGFLIVDHEVMQVQKGYPFSGTSVLTVPVLRGQDGTATTAHPTGARVTVALGTDLASDAAQVDTGFPIGTPARPRVSISVTGALPLPTPGNDLDVILNGAVVIAATLAAPTLDMDGSTIRIYSNGLAAHTVTVAGGLGLVGAAADVLTWKADQRQGTALIAVNASWVPVVGIVAGAATIAGVGLA